MNIILLGPPGSGKGTQGNLLAEKYGMVHLSVGAMFREFAKSDPKLTEIMARGDLIPDVEVSRYLDKYINDNNLMDNLILDGSPKSLYQYLDLKKIFGSYGKKIDYAIYVKISDEEAIRRLSSRRLDKKTGKIYNLVTEPPEPEVDPKDLIQREDDTEDAVRERLKIQEIPWNLLDALRDDGILLEIDGERPVEVIFKDIIEKIETKKKL